MKIIGTGSALPELEVTNDMLKEFLDTNDEWITTRTGIKSRRVLSKESVSDLAFAASKAAIENAGIQPEDIDFILCHNVLNDHITPALAAYIQAEIGAKCPAMDIDAACAGFVYALYTAEAMLQRGDVKKILITCAEQMTRIVDWEKRENCILFGDGAGAVIVTAGGSDALYCLGTKSEYIPPLHCDAIYTDTPYKKETTEYPYLVMKGRDVFKLAVLNSVNDINAVIEKGGLKPNDIDKIMLHQANMRIIDGIRQQMELPEEKFPHNIEYRGNTSSASIPMLLDELNRAGQIKDGENIVFSAFGAGFTSGACLFKWSK